MYIPNCLPVIILCYPLCVDASDAQTVQSRTDSDHKEHAAPGTRETALSQSYSQGPLYQKEHLHLFRRNQEKVRHLDDFDCSLFASAHVVSESLILF